MREEKQWLLHKEISHESGITIRINKLELRKPIYSFELGVLKDTGYLNRFFPGGLSWETDFASIITDLISQATSYIDDIQFREAEESVKTESDRLERERAKRSQPPDPLDSRRDKNRQSKNSKSKS